MRDNGLRDGFQPVRPKKNTLPRNPPGIPGPSANLDERVLSCAACTGKLHLINGFYPLHRVSSDCKPFPSGGCIGVCPRCGLVQKPRTPQFRHELLSIYEHYTLYFQGRGQEQRVVGSKTSQFLPRSVALSEFAMKSLPIPENGGILDFGCGQGQLLDQFSRRFPHCELCGYEITSQHQESLQRIPQFRRLFTGDLSRIDRTFDLIVFNHSLEHLCNPINVLRQIQQRLAPEGNLLIQIPDLESNPFDLIVADHVCHFSFETLSALLTSAGFEVVMQHRGISRKEMTVVAKPAATTGGPPSRPVKGNRVISWPPTLWTG